MGRGGRGLCSMLITCASLRVRHAARRQGAAAAGTSISLLRASISCATGWLCISFQFLALIEFAMCNSVTGRLAFLLRSGQLAAGCSTAQHAVERVCATAEPFDCMC